MVRILNHIFCWSVNYFLIHLLRQGRLVENTVNELVPDKGHGNTEIGKKVCKSC